MSCGLLFLLQVDFSKLKKKKKSKKKVDFEAEVETAPEPKVEEEAPVEEKQGNNSCFKQKRK